MIKNNKLYGCGCGKPKGGTTRPRPTTLPRPKK